MKLALGTAQFGMDYGINNTRGRIPEKEVHLILGEALRAGVSLLDTAPSYGADEALIGSYAALTGAAFHVVSKYTADGVDVSSRARQTLADLHMPSLYAMLVHRYGDYQKDPSVWQQLRALRDAGIATKIGFSLYYPEHLAGLLARLPDIDLVQVPLSVADRRFVPYLDKLRDRGIEVHVRSVFLQGLLFKHDDALTGQFAGAADPVRALRRVAEEHKISIAAAALRFVLGHDAVGAAVVGVDGVDHLRELIACARDERFDASLAGACDRCVINDENILLPFLWKTS